METKSIQYPKIDRRNWASEKEPRFQIRPNPMIMTESGRKKTEVKRRRNLVLCSRERQTAENTLMTSDFWIVSLPA
jgi:hypothetical protein